MRNIEKDFSWRLALLEMTGQESELAEQLQKFIQPWITVRFGCNNFDFVSLANPAVQIQTGKFHVS